MQSITLRKQPKKVALLISVSLVILVLMSGLLWYYVSDASFGSKNPSQSSPTNSENDQSDTTTAESYIEAPIIDEPEISSDYPIESESYKIEQEDSRRYIITLYPGTDNSEDPNYNSEIRAQKNKAIRYLQERYGSVTNFSFEWNPENAENL